MNSDFNPLFDRLEAISPLGDVERGRLSACLSRRILRKGDFFVRGGQSTREAAYLVSGLIRYYYVAPSGREFVKHFCLGGQFVSSYVALVKGEPSAYFIEALETTELIVFDYADWLALLDRAPVWGKLNNALQIDALAHAEKRERSLILDDAATRYLDLLKEYPNLENRVRQYDIANYLGITPVALSRIRGKPVPRK